MRQSPIPMAGLALVVAAVAFLAGARALLAQTSDAAADVSSETPAVSAEERRLFALNLYHEARSQGRDGMIAVGWVVFNRIADPEYPDSISAVINQRRGRNCEWGWTCDGRSDEPREADMWTLAQDVADVMLGATRPADPTQGALWFHETFRRQPGWMRNQVRRTVTLQDHHYYARN